MRRAIVRHLKRAQVEIDRARPLLKDTPSYQRDLNKIGFELFVLIEFVKGRNQ
jgi:hypothetical protein